MSNGGDNDGDDDDVFSAYGDGDGTRRRRRLRGNDDDDDDANCDTGGAGVARAMNQNYHRPMTADLELAGSVSTSTNGGLLGMLASPLMEFFSHIPSGNAESLDATTSSSLAHFHTISHCCERRSSSMTLKEFLTRRLFTMDEREGENNVESDNSGERGDIGNDDCSFSSGMMDEPILECTAERADNCTIIGDGDVGDVVVHLEGDEREGYYDDLDEEDTTTQLQTQPLLLSEKHSNNHSMEQLTEPAVLSAIYCKNFVGGEVKRTLGFDSIEHGDSNDEEEDDEANQLETQPQTTSSSIPRCLKGNKEELLQRQQCMTSKKRRSALQRGKNWDGNFQSIPHSGMLRLLHHAPR